MNIEKNFEIFNSNIRLTESQENDAKTKYKWVCKKLHEHFYENIKYTWDTKFLFGSYKNKTNIIPFTEDQDVDVLFKLNKEIFNKYDEYESNWQSALLQDIRKILLDSKYSLWEKPKAWWKVILVKTSDWTHNIELLPAFEENDWSFIIPNSEDWGKWEKFNPREEVQKFKDSNSNTNWFTASLIRMVKSWRNNNSTLSLKSYRIEKYSIDFLDSYDKSNKETLEIIYDFFKFLLNKVDETQKSYVETGISRIENALEYIEKDDEKKALDELGKVFGIKFPVTIQKIAELEECEDRIYEKSVNVIWNNPPKPWLWF